MQIDSGLILQILFLLVLVAVNAFFSSSEIAIISLNENKIKRMAEEGNKKARLLHNLLSEPSRFLATIQVGITLSTLMSSAVASESFSDRFAVIIKSAGLPLDVSMVKVISVVLITILLSYFTLVFGELVPKRVAMQVPERMSMAAIKPLSMLSFITSPFVRFLTFTTNFVIKVFGGNPNTNEEKITEEEIRLMVDVGEERGAIRGAEKEMIDNIFEFDNTLVSEIMTHRTEIVGFDVRAGFDEVIKTVINEKFTRFPVYDETLDNIIGVLHVKDLIQYINNRPDESFGLKQIIRKPYYVPESKKTDELFKELKKNKTHMAIIIDEYGGTAGIVTIEDLLEEIVGSIFDEYDDEEKDIEKIDENTYVIDGTVSLDSVMELLDSELPVDEYETLSGFLIGQLGRIPSEEENPVIEYGRTVFKVEKVDEKRIARVKVCKG